MSAPLAGQFPAATEDDEDGYWRRMRVTSRTHAWLDIFIRQIDSRRTCSPVLFVSEWRLLLLLSFIWEPESGPWLLLSVSPLMQSSGRCFKGPLLMPFVLVILFTRIQITLLRRIFNFPPEWMTWRNPFSVRSRIGLWSCQLNSCSFFPGNLFQPLKWRHPRTVTVLQVTHDYYYYDII